MKESVKIFKSLGTETRYLIVKALFSGEKCACGLPKIIGRTQSNTSMHLAKLLQAGIVKHRREGKSIFYSIKNEKVREIIKVLENK